MCNWRSIVLAAISPLIFQVCTVYGQELRKAGPVFSKTGPHAEDYGEQLGYPVGWPFDKPQNMVSLGVMALWRPQSPTHSRLEFARGGHACVMSDKKSEVFGLRFS